MTVLATPDKTGSGFPLGFDAILDPSPLQYLDEHGALSGILRDDAPELAPERLLATWRAMVIGRRFDVQATTIVRQGRLAVYPSSFGQEACQLAATMVLREGDWLFPTYRDSVSIMSRGRKPARASSFCSSKCL